MVEPTGVKRKLAVILAADAEGILARLWRGWRRALFFFRHGRSSCGSVPYGE